VKANKDPVKVKLAVVKLIGWDERSVTPFDVSFRNISKEGLRGACFEEGL
jgi:hypothetical protein